MIRKYLLPILALAGLVVALNTVLSGAKPVPVRAADEDGFVPSAETVAEAINPHTRLLMLNSPSNPGGSVYSRDEVRALADLAKDRDLIVVSDEIYEKILYEGEHVSPASLDGMSRREAKD